MTPNELHLLRAGMVAIRNLLHDRPFGGLTREQGREAAFALAEALHNFEGAANRVTAPMTAARLLAVAKTWPTIEPSIQPLIAWAAAAVK